MASITTRTGKGSPLTFQELDANFTNLNTDKLEKTGGSAAVADLTLQSVSSTLHRSPNAITALFVYDTSKDSDGGAWTEKCQHTSWYQETIYGKWLGAQTSESAARAVSGATTDDYYQLTTDGKFYKLNATSGTTEVFRGNKRAFPKLAAIVTEAASVTIYDLTEPGRPMWLRFKGGSGTWLSAGNWSSVAVLNGLLSLGANNGASLFINFVSEWGIYRYSGSALQLLAPMAGRNDTNTTLRNDALGLIANNIINAIAMTVLPDAPVDPVSGLKVPTIAVATAGGLSLIQNTGTVRNSSSTSAFTQVTLTPQLLSAGRADAVWYYAANPGSLGASFALTTKNASTATDFNVGNTTRLMAKDRANYARTSGAVVQLLRNNEGAIGKGIAAKLSDTYNTGWLAGDIRRAYLSDVNVGGVTGPELVTNGTFDTDVSGWIATASNLTSVSSQLVITATSAAVVCASQGLSFTIGRTYKITLALISSPTGISIGIDPGLVNGNYAFVEFSGAGTKTFYWKATATSAYLNVRSSGAATVGQQFTFDNISVKEIIPDRSYKSAASTINGTLTATAVNTGNDLVAYSGFSAANYLREAYSADLDFGTGEWSCSAWVNVPTSLPSDSSFPVSPTELITNGGSGFSDTSGWSSASQGTISVSGGAATFTTLAGDVLGGAARAFTTVSGSRYRITIDCQSLPVSGSGRVGVGSGVNNSDWFNAGGAVNVTTTGVTTLYFTAQGTSAYINVYAFSGNTSANQSLVLNSVSVKQLMPLQIAARAHTSGPYITLSIDATNKLTATAYDGTTTRTVTTTAAYNTGTWLKARANYTTDGKLAILVNGGEVAATTGTALLTLNNSNAVLTIGNSYALDAPFPGSIALLKFSATVPTAEQALFMYEQEKHLFSAGAKCVLPASTNVLDLAYDDATDTWSTLQATHEASFSGLVRTSTQGPTAGSFSRTAESSGVQLLARTTTNPGVDVRMPAKNLRSKDMPRDINQDIVVFDFDAVTSQTDFLLPVGYTTRAVYSAGSQKRIGSTKDYTVLFDGFRETVRFGTAPGNGVWVQIHAVKEVSL